jgi:hypothetical protein
MSTTTLRSRVTLSSLSAWLAVGDAAALSVFFTIGAESHGFQPFANPSVVAEGVAPFLLTWLLAAAVTGLYDSDTLDSPARTLSVGIPTWILAALAGHGLRATSLFRGDTAWTFMLVSIVVGGGLLVGWRLVASLAYVRR